MTKTLALLSILLAATTASAQVRVPVQGFLTDSGVPVDGTQTLRFRVLDVGAVERSCEDQTLDIDNGFFNAILGEPGATSCGQSDIEPGIFAGISSLEVELGGTVLGNFPIGDAPSAGFAQVAASTTTDLPNIIRAPDVDALLAALANAGSVPTVIELGAGTYTLPGNTVTVPVITDIRGPGSTAATIAGEVILSGNNRLSGVRVLNTAANGVAVVIRGVAGEVELIDVAAVAAAVANSAQAVVIEAGDIDTRVVIRDSKLEALSPGGCVGLAVNAVVDLTVHDTSIFAASTDNIAVAIRQDANGIADFNMRLTDVKIDVSLANAGFGAGFEANAAAGFARIVDTEIRVLATNGRAISANGGDVRLHGALVAADVPFFANAIDVLKVANSGVEAFLGANVDVTSAAVACVNSYNDATTTALGTDCS